MNVNHVETFAFTAWTVPEAVVNVYDGAGVQAVSFRGEEILASPESLMAWNEVADATIPVVLPDSNTQESSSNAYLASDSDSASFDLVSPSTASDEFSLVDFDGTEDNTADTGPLFDQARGAVQIAVEAFLQFGQPYPGDDHVQTEPRFLVYQTSDTEHVVMDNMVDGDVLIPTQFILDDSFDIIAWYAAHRRRVLRIPEDDGDDTDLPPDASDSPDSDSEDGGEDGPDGAGGAVHAYVAEVEPPRKYVVVVDSGATEHCFWRREDFSEYHPIESREGNAAGGSKFRILATGVVRKTFTYQGQKKEIVLDAIHTPDITANLISISKLDSKGYAVEFVNGKAMFKRRDGSPFMEAALSNGMYVLELEGGGGVNAWAANSRDVPADKGTWHHRLGHIGNTGLAALISGKHVNGLHVREGGMDGLCEDCVFGKQTRRPFDGGHKVEEEVGERSYMDLWGPAQVTSVGGKRWFTSSKVTPQAHGRITWCTRPRRSR